MQKKEKIETIADICEKKGISMTYHRILFLIKIFLLGRTVLDFIQSWFNAYSLYRTIDQIIYVVLAVFMALSIWKHDSKKGVIYLFAFVFVELAFNIFVYFQGSALGIEAWDQMIISICAGTLIVSALTFLYYRKRWHELP